MQDLKDKN